MDLAALLRHMEWADALTWKAVLGLTAPSDPRVRDLVYHLHTVQWVYLQVWRGEPIRVAEATSFADLPALGRRARAYYGELPVFLEKLHGAAVQRTVEFPWAAQVAERYGSAGPATLADSVLQVAMHSAYHRGQLATRVRELGGAPDVSDYIAWVWMGRPAPGWPDLGAAP